MAYQLEYTGAEVDRRLGLAGNIPTKVSDLTNDSGFITKSVNDLVNYYLKSETYTKAQVESLIAAISQFRYVVVATLPTASADTMNKIYLVPSDNPETQNVKDEYITLETDGVYTWEQIGSTAIDLSDYVTETQLNTALAGYVQKLTSVPEGNLAVVDSTGGIKDGGIGIAELAKVVSGDGIAAYLVDTQSAGTEQNFTFRQSGGDGVANYKKIKGRTLVWNQLIPLVDGLTTMGVTFTANGDGSYIVNGTATGGDANLGLVTNITSKMVVGHKYLLSIKGNTNVRLRDTYSGSFNTTTSMIYTLGSAARRDIALSVLEGQTANNERVYAYITDLTAMFQAGNEPATVAEFTAIYDKPYYAFTPSPVLLPYKGEGIKVTGVNQWDEELEFGYLGYSPNNYGQPLPNTNLMRSKNFIEVLPNTTYYTTYGPNVDHFIWPYDANKRGGAPIRLASGVHSFTTPANCFYIKFCTENEYGTTYKHDICINLSNPSINGQYFPYVENTLSLPIVGKTAKDGNGNAIVPFPAGMHGTPTVFDVARKAGGSKVMGVVNMRNLSWSFQNESGIRAFYADIDGIKVSTSSSVKPNIICNRYETGIPSNLRYNSADKVISTWYNLSSQRIGVNDSAFSNADDFAASLDGVYLVYELAAPIPFTWDEPLCTYIPVDELGTEKLLPEGVDEDGIPATAPFRADTTYSISIANLVRKLNALSNE